MKQPDPLEPQLDPFAYQDFKFALQWLKVALDKGPCYALLLGESGTGKTTLLRTLRLQLDSGKHHVVYLCHGRPSPSGLGRVLAHHLHLPLNRTRAETSQLLVQTLRNIPTKLLFWIDEAQMMSDDTLHEIRLLAEADLLGPPLFTVLLTGLPLLKEKLRNPNLFALWRRIHPKLHLRGLRQNELTDYISHRFDSDTAARFEEQALLVLFEHSRAIPALVDLIVGECIRLVPQDVIHPESVSEIIEQLDI